MDLILKIKRGETPFYARLRAIAKAILQPELPVPRFLLPVARFLFNFHYFVWSSVRWFLAVFYNAPLFRGRCESAGRGLFVFLLPQVIGHTRIRIGNGVRILGKIGIQSARVMENPTLEIHDRVFISHMVQFVVNQEVVVEEGVLIASHCSIADSDSHPRDAAARAREAPPPKEEIKPVRICRNAWIGEGSTIRKGVTIGEGAIIGAHSVVLKDVPPYCIAMGNPARVVGFAGQG
jgi:acetyltransferase-like isoleucine patch superfamily enzyme